MREKNLACIWMKGAGTTLGQQEEEGKEEALNASLIGLAGVLPFFTQFCYLPVFSLQDLMIYSEDGGRSSET
jgi:hypothetical protein